MKRKLLFAMLCIVGVLGLRAQTDVTSTYITNPSFELSAESTNLSSKIGPNSSEALTIYGWTETLPDAGTTQNSGVYSSSDDNGSPFGAKINAASSSTYYFFYRHGWNRGSNTSDCILSTSSKNALPAGAYNLSIRYQMSYSEDNATTKDTKIKLEVKKGSDILGTNITDAATKGNTFGNDKWVTLNCFFNVTGSETIDFVITLQAGGDKRSDFLVDDVRLESISNGDELTSLITNAAVTGTSGWTNGRIGQNQQYTSAPDNTYLDTWNNTLDQKQVINLPAGYYLLKAATRASAYASGNIYAYATADDVTFRTDIHTDGNTGNLLGNGWGWTRVPVTLTKPSSVTLGFWSKCNNNQWAGADNFTLVYYDSEQNLAAALFEQVREDASAWKSSLDATISTGAKNLLAAEDGKSYSSAADYNDATERLEAAITFARSTYPSLKAKYDNVKALVKALPNQTEIYTGSATINVDEAAADAQVDAATTEDGINAVINIWRNAAATFLGSVTVNDGKYFDITNIFLNNANFSDGNILGWETNYVSGQQAQNIGYQGSSYTEGDVTITQFIEAWKPQPNTLGDGYLRQTVTNLPEGKYILEADAISVQQKDENLEVAGSYLYIFADGVNYTTPLNTLNNKPQHFSKEFLFTGEGEVQFGLKTESSTGNWLCADNFTVKFYGVDLSAYETQMEDAVAAANAVTAIPAGAKSVLDDVVTANNKTYTTSRAYADAISAIQVATATAKAFETPYADYNTAKATAEAFTEESMIATDWSALQSAISSNTVNEADVEITVETLTTATTNLNAASAAASTAVTAKNNYDNIVTAVEGKTNVVLTSYLTNPGFNDGNTNGWNNDGSITANAQNNASFDNKEGSHYAERWHVAGTIDINQTLAYVPAGVYQVEAKMYSDTKDAKLYAGAENVAVSTSGTYSVNVEVADKGSIKFGASCTLTDATWICIDDFKITYLCASVNDLTYTLADGKMGTDKSAAQTAAANAFEENKNAANYNVLLAAIADAEVSVVNYTNLKAAIDAAKAVRDANNFVTADATTAFESAITTAENAWKDVTYTDAQATTAITSLGATAGSDRAGAAGQYMASAWGKTNENWNAAPYINTWSVEANTDGSDFYVPFFEYYVSDTNNLGANTFTATLTGLENGMYEVELWARVQRRSDADFNADNSMITMSVNGGEAQSIMSNTENNVGSGTSVMRLGRYTARGKVTDGTLALSIDVKLGANVHWLSWRDVKYTKLEEANMYIAAGKYGTFVAPFDVAIPDGVTAQKVTGVKGSTLNFEGVTTTIFANTPVVVWSEKAIDETFYGKSVAGTPEAGLLTGVLTTGTTVPAGSYVLQTQDGVQAFYRLESDATANTANRAYLNVDANVKAFFFNDEDADGINAVEATAEDGRAIYNLAGQRVKKAQKGLYIIGGKTVLVK